MRQYDHLVKRFSVSEERKDFRIAKLGSIIYNANNVKRKGGSKKAWFPQDFLPKKEKSNWQDQLMLVEILNKAFGGLDKRKN